MYLPTAFCYYGYSDPDAIRFCKADSNGNAAGGSLEDAIVRGFLELVERDCAAIWWYNRISRAGINLDSFDSPLFEKVRRHYGSRGRQITVLDISSDLEIPTCVALSRPENGDLSGLTLGFGASFDVSDAIRRALLEMTQLMPFVKDGGSTTSLTGLPAGPEVDDWWLWPAQDLPPKTAADFSSPGTPDLEHCLGVAAQHGLEVLLLDQTRAEVGLPVVKVLVPSLRPWWPRFAPGRLYDVPVQMGWLARPVSEEALNPAWLSL
jgi:ribosomal protein S12 methylthiotransferase accessory factor